MSLPEVLLWQIFRRQPGGLKFRRQHPIGRYVLDFHVLELKLAIEIDGIGHEMGDRPERDETRDHWLESQGIRMLRIAAKDVLADPAAVADSIVRICTER
ncbi:endonuclease domain-containing protein [Sphingopyxis sp.]|uniref:endonuclease domain-containing protein n=1 Tax=Sphingopyxis sp. TaxID=1908224 RepID=UPI0039C8F150